MQNAERHDVMCIKTIRCVKFGLFVFKKSINISGKWFSLSLASRLSCTYRAERAQRTRKLGGPHRYVAGRMLEVAVPCRCIPSAGCWAGSLVVRGKGLVVAKVDQLEVVGKLTVRAVFSVKINRQTDSYPHLSRWVLWYVTTRGGKVAWMWWKRVDPSWWKNRPVCWQ